MRGFCVIVALLCTLHAHGSTRKVIVDQDGAPDPADSDTNALFPIMRSSAIDLVGITASTGDSWMLLGAARFQRVLELDSRTEVPIYGGSTYPQSVTVDSIRAWNERKATDIEWLGAFTRDVPRITKSSQLEASMFPEGMPELNLASRSGAEAIVYEANASPGQVSLLLVGPLTTLAAAIQIDPSLPSLIDEVFFMGGAFGTLDCSKYWCESTIDPTLEFNVYFDAGAARSVLRPGLEEKSKFKQFTMVPADICSRIVMSDWLHEVIGNSSNPLAEYISKYEGTRDRSYPMWDEATATVMSVIFEERSSELCAKYVYKFVDILGVDPDLDEYASLRLYDLDEETPHPKEWYQTVRLMVDVDTDYIQCRYAEYVIGETLNCPHSCPM